MSIQQVGVCRPGGSVDTFEPVVTRATQAERRERSESALLAAAAEVISERGIDGASFAQIAERAGTSRNLGAHHFRTKDALIARLAERTQDRFDTVVTSAITSTRGELADLPVLEIIRGTIDTYLALFENPTPEDRALIVMWGATFPSESSLDGMLDADRRAYDGWARMIEKGQQDRSIRSDADPAGSAVILHGLLRGVAALILTESDYANMSTVRAAIDSWVYNALAPAEVDRHESVSTSKAGES